VNPYEYTPSEFQLPAGDESVSLTWRSNIGPSASVGTIAAHLADLQTALDVGASWGLVHAEEAASQAFEREAQARGLAALTEISDQWPNIAYLQAYGDWEYFPIGPLTPEPRGGRYLAWPRGIARLASSSYVPELLGDPIRVAHVEYENPIEVVLFGAGLVLMGTVKVLRMIRDWSSQQRIGEAIADAAEATAQQAQSAADLGRWLVDEARAGRQHVPIGELMSRVTPSDLDAIRRLADSDVQLQLPQGMGDQAS